ncbi:hypothetical protein GR254_25205, partial [Mycobacterium tuberculosis]|nr:hypothetical protein [Mycobacterium tuberculosis]
MDAGPHRPPRRRHRRNRQRAAHLLEAALTVKPAELQWTLARTDHPDADTEETASALLTC